MKKLLVAAALALLAAGCNNAANNSQGNNQQNQNPASNKDLEVQIYKNGTYGFEFNYPDSFVFVTPTYASLQDKIVQVQFPRNSFLNTNFGDAGVAVSASYAKSSASCLKLSPPNGGDGFRTKVQINGVDFYKTQSMDAAAGNRYQSTVYRAFVGTQTCIELNETIHTSAIENYTPGTVSEVDKAAIQKQLDDILNTFRFTK